MQVPRRVLEVRSFDVPFLLEDGQNVGRLVYEKMLDTPDKVYGMGMQIQLSSARLEAEQTLHYITMNFI